MNSINIKDPSLSNLKIKGRVIENLKIKGRAGTWYAVKTHIYGGSTFLQLESEQHGDEAEHIIVNTRTMEEPSKDFSYHLLFEAE